ncbi:SubName: Full=Uncharacterized protein {ECO:0000313/EMBL:CCA75155.1} [Serendipita indica DSM 11827]|nr:SubName: Full=Uncharacterized protein {ECO:0000313/EMBL:CCA75155.1} [Serendipita indica DSM 11827]
MTRLLHLLSGTLIRLLTYIGPTHLDDTINAVGRMKRLEALNILINNDFKSAVIPNADYKGSSLISLTLWVDSTYIHTADLIASFCRYRPPLKWLSVSGKTRISAWKFDLRSLECLRDLALDFPELPVTEIPNVESFSVVASVGQFRYWRSASVLHLRCGITVQEPDQPFFTLDSCCWPNIESLTIEDRHLRPDPQLDVRLNLSNLRQIMLYPGDEAGICHELAMHPQGVPRLEEIRLIPPPEWDILFIMIERRLALSVKGLTPISQLTFGCAPPEEIRVPLVSLLKGHITRRLSNYELSVQGNILLVLGRHQ